MREACHKTCFPKCIGSVCSCRRGGGGGGGRGEKGRRKGGKQGKGEREGKRVENKEASIPLFVPSLEWVASVPM